MDNYFTLSVIIPVYNCEAFRGESNSLSNGATEVTEIIVVNDGSTDASPTILDRLQLQNPILKLFHHQNKLNKGRSPSRNLGIQKTG
jgi:glycosyltransferase involved in cell wall biosynthesis